LHKIFPKTEKNRAGSLPTRFISLVNTFVYIPLYQQIFLPQVSAE